MRGHTEIMRARMSKMAPSFVFINDYPCKTDWFENHDHATVCTHGDSLSSADFRFLVGLRVSISAMTEDRAKALFERVKAAGAAVVAACHVGPESRQGGWADVFHKAEK